jgi:hypothetical protein
LDIWHRYAGDLTEDPKNTVFGLGLGANTALGMKVFVMNFGISGAYAIRAHETRVGADYYFRTPFLSNRLNVEYFGYPQGPDRIDGMFAEIVMQAEPIRERVYMAADVGYNNETEDIGLGFGLSVKVLEDIMYFKSVNVVAEYFSLKSAAENSFAGGVALKTHGHQFMVCVQNCQAPWSRHLMYGANDRALRLGFNIKRTIRI